VARVALLAAGLFAFVAGAGCFGEGDPLATDPSTALGPLEVADAYSVLESGEAEKLPAVFDDLVEREDRRFIAPLIEVLRASQLGLLTGSHHNALIVTLERLSGQPLGADWFKWVTWYRGTSLEGPPGFAEFKARLLYRIEPTLGDFVEASPAAEMRTEELLWTGSGVDQPGALQHPPRVPAGESLLAPEEAVVGLFGADAPLAVPLRYLDWHEFLNDRHAGVDYVLVSCVLCGSVTAFEAPVHDGKPSLFAASGLLMRSVRLMYDDGTRTLWNELTGRAAFGPRAETGERLRSLPVVVTTWGAWLEQHPESSAVELPGGEERYKPGNPWGEYMISPEPAFPVGLDRAEFAPKVRVVGLEIGLRTKAWALEPLMSKRVLHDELDGRPIVLIAARGPVNVMGLNQRVGELEYTVGAEVRAFFSEGPRFRAGSAQDTLETADGDVWRIGEDALHGPGGEQFARLRLTPAFWFAWQAFHPSTEVWPPAE